MVCVTPEVPRPSAGDDPAEREKRTAWLWRHRAGFALFIILAVAAVLRLRLLDVPLERDEGEYAYAGQLMLEGIPPYAKCYNMKFPGVYAAYALIMALFGQSITGIHLGLLLVNAASIVLLYKLAARIFDPLTGLAAAAAFALMSISPAVHGIYAHAEHFVVLCALGGLLLVLRSSRSRSGLTLLLAGVLFGLAFIMKQQGAPFAVLGALVVLAGEARGRPVMWGRVFRRLVVFGLGVALPIGITVAFLYAAGVFEQFWIWTFDYAASYVTAVSPVDGLFYLNTYGSLIVEAMPLLLGLAVLGLAAFVWDRSLRRRSAFAVAFLLLSAAATSAGFYFRPHYFIHVLPAAALLAGAGIAALARLAAGAARPAVRIALPAVVAACAWGEAVYDQADYLFSMTPAEISRLVYGPNPFPEAVEVGRFIRENSAESDTVAVLGSEPQIHFYSRRHSATGYIYVYALMEGTDLALWMQEDMIREIESARPEYIVVVDVLLSWDPRPDSHERLRSWMYTYCRQFYRPVGSCNIRRGFPTSYAWGNKAILQQPAPGSSLGIFRRKPLLPESQRITSPDSPEPRAKG